MNQKFTKKMDFINVVYCLSANGLCWAIFATLNTLLAEKKWFYHVCLFPFFCDFSSHTLFTCRATRDEKNNTKKIIIVRKLFALVSLRMYFIRASHVNAEKTRKERTK